MFVCVCVFVCERVHTCLHTHTYTHTHTGEQCGVFAGVLSTQNNGGFASVRGPAMGYDLSRYLGLAVEFVGDNRQYKLVVHPDRKMDSPSYQV